MIKLNERTTRKVGFCAGTIASKVRCVPPHLHLYILATSKQWADRSLGSDTLSLAHERKVESRGQGLVQFTRFTTNSTALQVEAMHLHTRLIPRIPVTGQKVNALVFQKIIRGLKCIPQELRVSRPPPWDTPRAPLHPAGLYSEVGGGPRS